MKKKLCLFALAILFLLYASACTRQNVNDTSPQAPAAPIRVSTDNTDAAEPAVATSRDGSIYVVWVEHRKDGQGDVFVRKTNSAGAQAAAPLRINPEVGRATAWRGDPPTVAVAPDGTIFVAWTARASEKGHENNLYLSASRDGGTKFEAPIKINDDEKPGVHGMHSMAIDNNGRIYLAWLDERNLTPAAPMEKHRGEAHAMEANREVFTAYSEDGGRTISRNQLIAREACPCCKTALTTSADGKVYVGWRQVLTGDLRHIAVASSVDNGRTFSPTVIVSDDKWAIAGCPVSGPALFARRDGILQVLWYTEGDAGEQGLYLTQSSDGAKTFSARQLVAKGAARGNPSITSDAEGMNPIALWETGQGNSHSVMLADLSGKANSTALPILLSQGELPAVAISNARPVAAFISTINNQRSVWLIVKDRETSTASL